MDKKRHFDHEKDRIRKKIRRLEQKIMDLPESDSEEAESVGPVEEEDKENCSVVEVDDAILEFAEDEIQSPDKLDACILEALGVEAVNEEKTLSLRKEIADVWTSTLTKGLKKEEKEKINQENIHFNNIPGIPKLNPEASNMMTDMAKRRDSIIEIRQRQLSTVLGCLGSTLHLCLASDLEENKITVIKKINEAARLICDSIYLDTKGRRSLILSSINRDMKDALTNTEPENFLFGEKLFEKINTAKTVKKSAEALKIPSRPSVQFKRPEFRKSTGQALNWRGPPRPAEPRSQRGRQAGPRHPTRPQEKKRTIAEDRSFRPYHR